MSDEKEEFKDASVVATMSPGLYWEWRCTIEERKSANLDYRRVSLEKQIMLKDLEIQKLRLATFKSVEKRVQDQLEASKNEYDRMKQRIEKELDIDFTSCIIDDITFDIKKIEE